MTERDDQHQDSTGKHDRRASGPSFADTNIAATEEQQTASRRAGPRTTDEAGEATTAAVPEPDPERTCEDERRSQGGAG